MHVNAKRIAYAGVLAALSAVLIFMSTVIETSSLFFIAAASFCVGISIREWGIRFGIGFWIASSAVNFIVCPNKFYCATYAAMGLYLLFGEWLWEWIADRKVMKHRKLTLWGGKYLIFNCVYIPALLFFSDLLFVRKVEGIIWLLIFVAGQIGLFLYDCAYRYFQSTIWGKMRSKIFKNDKIVSGE